MPEGNIWGIHMPLEHGTAPIEKSYIAIDWSQMGDLSKIPPNREAFKTAYAKAYPSATPGNIPVAAGVPYRFVAEIRKGDMIVYPSKIDRMVNIGIVDGDYSYVPSDPYGCPQHRAVKWEKHIHRSVFSQSALNEIGSAITLFSITTNSDEFVAALKEEAFQPESNDEVSAEKVSEQVQLSTEDFIIKRLKGSQTPYQFEHFFAHLLRCMGYFARVTKASGDGGVDIIAHRDELGFEPPIIKVQCKQIVSTIGRPDVQKLFGAIEQGEKGLFVTLGSYTAEARTFEQTKTNLRLIDGETLIELIYAHYHKFEPRYQMLLPLKRSYIPGVIAADPS